MGTSNPFNGGNNRNPLIPDWVDGAGPPLPAIPPPVAPPAAGVNPVTVAPGDANPGGGGTDTGNPNDGGPDGSGDGDAAPPNRFQSGRTNFFKFAKTGGGGTGGSGAGIRNMRRAVRSFVGKASGGAHRAARRMASERSATASLGRILSQASSTGIREAVRQLGYERLAALPVPDIYAALVDVICAPGGELDESFAREAYIKALAEVSAGGADLERPTAETSVAFLASFIANAIQNRLLNAIGNKVVSIPPDVASIQNIEQQINDHIRGSVDDAIAEAGADFPLDEIVGTIDAIYERSLDLLEHAQDIDARDEDGDPHDSYQEVA